ncbi:MAG: fatty acid desaturase family protein [Bacteroidota bacterium]|jgi:linoleoyl-CoA desaturase|nr:acyl-CoA desaturase [Sphingobacteriales bacterium]
MKTPLKQQIKFAPDEKSLFFPMLKKRVDGYFQENNLSKFADKRMYIKSIILLSTYFIPFLILIFFTPAWPLSLIVWFLMGIGIAGIGMSVMHDANHGSYSSNKTINFLMGHTLNAIGGSVLNWKLQHNILHHTYTNITHIDEDIEDRLVLKFSPHTKTKWFHRFQWIYAIFFYGLLTLYWALFKDFVQFVQFSKNGVNAQSRSEKVVSLVKIIAIKVFYFCTVIGAPYAYCKIPLVQIVIGFLLMHFVAGIILTVIFQLAHTLEHTAHPLPSSTGVIETDWAIHQLQTTVNFAPNNKWLSWYVGGLNYQIEHHLFPKISHVHYPAISIIVKATAKEFGIPYHENNTLFQAIRSHFKFMKEIGKLPDLHTAIG